MAGQVILGSSGSSVDEEGEAGRRLLADDRGADALHELQANLAAEVGQTYAFHPELSEKK